MARLNLHYALRLWTLLLAVLGLAACGGGGGGDGKIVTPIGGGIGGGTAGVIVTITDPASSSTQRTSISSGNPAHARATVYDANGSPVASTVVTFSITPDGLATITPPTATALTDASGVAFVQIDPASVTAAGAATITAAAAVAGEIVSGSIGFSVNAAAVGLANLAVSQNPLSAYGTTSVTVTVTGVPASTPVTVNFSSICAGSGKATLPASVQTANGVATATYKDNGCAGTDTITASIAGTAVTATVPLTVDPPGITSIQFVSATPNTIVLKGTGGAGMQESAIVVFKVVDNNNNPVPNMTVNFGLTTTVGGITLSTPSGQTGADGTVQVSVNAGTTPTPVWVTASVVSGGNTFTTQSTVLRISTGRPAQDRFSLSVGTHNIEGWNINGTTTSVNIHASDRLGNPVPDGTAINFVAEGAQIQPSCATVNGACSVTFTSANPRPTLDSEPSGQVTAGRVTVTAYALGEESFTDLNGSNLFEAGEPFNDLGDVFVDWNENNTWQQNEQFIPFGKTAACQPAGIASSPSAPSKGGNTCDGTWGTAHVRQDNLIILSGSTAFANPTSFGLGSACSAGFTLRLFDLNGNPMPAGTVVSANNPFPEGLTVTVTGGTPVADTTAAGGTLVGVLVKISDDKCAAITSGGFTLNVTSPGGTTTGIGIGINRSGGGFSPAPG